MMTNEDLWDNDKLQFARLLVELLAANEDLELEAVATSMDLQLQDVTELYKRAHKVFEEAKVNPPHSSNEVRTSLENIIKVLDELTTKYQRHQLEYDLQVLRELL
jgi:hypothetical protein